MSGMKKRENGKRLGNRRLFSMVLFGASVLFLLLVAVFWVCMAGCGIGHGFFKEEPSSLCRISVRH